MKTFTLYIPSQGITFEGDAIAVTNKIADNCNPFLKRTALLTQVMLSNNIIITINNVQCLVKVEV